MTFRFGAVTTLSITTMVLMACGGKTVSIGSESAAQTVVPSAVTVATGACSDGYQHANICCTGGGASGEPTCESYPNDPFHPCDSGWTTYPNAATCCSLDDPSSCTASCGNGSTGNSGECEVPPSSVSISPDGGYELDAGVTTCESRCPPGYTGISPYDSNGCCQTDNGVSSCFGEAVAAGARVANGDASVSIPTEPISACSFDCPDGWFVADAIEGLCCNNSSNGTEECFAAVFPDDNGGSASSPSTGVSNNGVAPTADASVGQ